MDIAFVVIAMGRPIAVHESKERAIAQAQAQANHRVKQEGCSVHIEQSFTPAEVAKDAQVRVGGSEGAPVMAAAPACVNCEVFSIVIQTAEGFAKYSVSQFPVIKESP